MYSHGTRAVVTFGGGGGGRSIAFNCLLVGTAVGGRGACGSWSDGTVCVLVHGVIGGLLAGGPDSSSVGGGAFLLALGTSSIHRGGALYFAYVRFSSGRSKRSESVGGGFFLAGRTTCSGQSGGGGFFPAGRTTRSGQSGGGGFFGGTIGVLGAAANPPCSCLLYTFDAAADPLCVDLGVRCRLK